MQTKLNVEFDVLEQREVRGRRERRWVRGLYLYVISSNTRNATGARARSNSIDIWSWPRNAVFYDHIVIRLEMPERPRQQGGWGKNFGIAVSKAFEMLSLLYADVLYVGLFLDAKITVKGRPSSKTSLGVTL